MEKAMVIDLLEKYWQAETTIAEEEALAAYFCGREVDAELLTYREFFVYFREEAEVSAGPDFGERILQRLGLPLDGEQTPVVPITRASFRLGVAGAAAAILLIVISLFLLKPDGRPTILAENRPAAQTAQETGSTGADSNSQGRTIDQGRSNERAAVTDTYDDPEQALVAVRHALLIASRNLNQGRRQLIGAHK
jgi:hypothetical protein